MPERRRRISGDEALHAAAGAGTAQAPPAVLPAEEPGRGVSPPRFFLAFAGTDTVRPCPRFFASRIGTALPTEAAAAEEHRRIDCHTNQNAPAHSPEVSRQIRRCVSIFEF